MDRRGCKGGLHGLFQTVYAQMHRFMKNSAQRAASLAKGTRRARHLKMTSRTHKKTSPNQTTDPPNVIILGRNGARVPPRASVGILMTPPGPFQPARVGGMLLLIERATCSPVNGGAGPTSQAADTWPRRLQIGHWGVSANGRREQDMTAADCHRDIGVHTTK